jgi:signal transduction histidine kinase
MTKLLNRPLRLFAIYSMCVLLASVPVYYWVIDNIWIGELDEHNLLVKERVVQGLNSDTLQSTSLDELIRIWNTSQIGGTLTPTPLTSYIDSYHTTTLLHSQGAYKVGEQLRVLTTLVAIRHRPYLLQVTTSVEETDETLLAIAMVTIGFFLILYLGFIIINRRIASKLWQPFKDTLTQIKHFNLDKDRTVLLPSSDIWEFNEMNTALTTLFERNKIAYLRQKEFSENASHELQTPIAILQSKLDIIQQDTSLTPSQAEAIDALHLPLSRVSRVNKNLLLLAKIDNHQYREVEVVHLTKIIEDTAEMLGDYIDAKQIKPSYTLQPNYHIKGNEDLVGIMISNLLVNVITHSAPHAEVSVILDKETLRISNMGTAPLDPAKLFKRFASSSVQHTGSGLGLAIVNQICQKYGWIPTYRYHTGSHHFWITFA